MKLLSTSEVLESNTVSLFTRNQTRSLFVLDMQVLTGNIQGRKADSQGGFQRKPRDKTMTCCSCLGIQLGSLGISPNTMMGSLAMLLLISSQSVRPSFSNQGGFQIMEAKEVEQRKESKTLDNWVVMTDM